MFKQILNEVQKKKEKKVNLNFLIKPSLKKDFDSLCKNNNTTMTKILNTFIEISLKNDKI